VRLVELVAKQLPRCDLRAELFLLLEGGLRRLLLIPEVLLCGLID
jgi:hypothetical protein